MILFLAGNHLGLFKRQHEKYNRKPWFRQLDTQGKGHFLYYNCEKSWIISSKLESKIADKECTMRGELRSDIPGKGWKCKFRGWHHDYTFNIRKGTYQPCEKLSIYVNGDNLEHLKEIEGIYLPSKKYSQGRVVYKHKSKDFFFHCQPKASGWYVKNGVGDLFSSDKWYIEVPTASSLCPADGRSEKNHRCRIDSYRYNDNDLYKEVKDLKNCSIEVNCHAHSNTDEKFFGFAECLYMGVMCIFNYFAWQCLKVLYLKFWPWA